MNLSRGTDVIAKKRIRFGNLWIRWAIFLCFCTTVLPPTVNAADDIVDTNSLSIAELQNEISEQGHVIRSFRVEGVVCAVVWEQKTIVLQDDSATIFLELPSLDDAISVGERVAIEGDHCSLVRSRFGVQVNSALTLENARDHGNTISGSVFLDAGLQPIHLRWFNYLGDPVLNLEYEGPGIPRQSIPGFILREQSAKTSQMIFQQGIHFESFIAKDWESLSNFETTKSVGEGTATNIDLAHRARSENTGLAFDGYLAITNTGVYTFHLSSHDGSSLYIGNPAPRCRTTILGQGAAPSPQKMGQGLTAQYDNQWIELQGEVTFAGRDADGLQLELTVQGVRAQVTVINNFTLAPANLLHQQIKVIGICEVTRDTEAGTKIRVIVPSDQQIEISNSYQNIKDWNPRPENFITSVDQVRRLKPEEARRGLQVKVRGVVIWASSFGCVLQDSTGGVYIHLPQEDEADKPRVGDLFEFEGTTDPGDFSPVIIALKAKFLGATTLPEPIQPTWDQLMNGSLDAEYVEIRGVITAISQTEITLLMPEGKLKIIADDNLNYPLPNLPVAATTADGETQVEPPTAFVGSVVRIRGCLTAIWDLSSGHLRVGVIHLSPAIVQVDNMVPSNPFSLPTVKTVDLLRFDPRASALQMTKISGQIIYIGQRECFISDGGFGLRVPINTPLSLRSGDLVEAVGFPELGGPSPVLQVARVRKIGQAQLPPPIQIPPGELLNHSYDSTFVKIEATLISDTVRLNERVLELQVGPIHFLARLNSDSPTLGGFSPGSRLELTGVYVNTSEDQASPNIDPFELLLNNTADIVVLQQPSWWTVRHAMTLIAILAGALGLAFVWITVLHRKIEERTVQLQEEIETRQLVEQRRVMEQERSRVARDLHDELGAGLTEVGILGALAKNPMISSKEKERYLDQLTESARVLVTGLDEIVWAINPHYDSISSLATYYSLFAQRFLNLAGIACRLQIAESFPEYTLDSKLRHGIFLAFKEALNNIVRHSGASEVEIRIEVTGNQLLITIHDNGRGLQSVASVSGSDGLSGMHERLRQLGGGCLIESHVGEGTNVELRLDLNRVLT